MIQNSSYRKVARPPLSLEGRASFFTLLGPSSCKHPCLSLEQAPSGHSRTWLIPWGYAAPCVWYSWAFHLKRSQGFLPRAWPRSLSKSGLINPRPLSKSSEHSDINLDSLDNGTDNVHFRKGGENLPLGPLPSIESISWKSQTAPVCRSPGCYEWSRNGQLGIICQIITFSNVWVLVVSQLNGKIKHIFPWRCLIH